MKVLRNPGLAGRLAVLVATLVVLAIGAVSVVAVRSLRDLAEAEAIVRVELAVAAGRETMRAWVDDVQIAASLLAERPTLRRLMNSADANAVREYLHQYCTAAELDVCAAAAADKVITTPGNRDIQAALAAIESGDPGGQLLVAPDGTLLAVGSNRLAGEGFDNTYVLVARHIDTKAVASMSDQAGLALSLVQPEEISSHDDAFTDLVAHALSNGDYRASLEISNSAGAPVALLQARLPREAVMQPVRASALRILVAGLIVGALAIGSAVLVGRHWASGVARLTDSARKLRAGDVTTPVRSEPGKELSVLSKTMEDMRRALAELEAARRTRDTVLANISHEFRTPLAAQLASIELLRDSMDDDMTEGERELVASLERGAKRLTRLIDNLLESVRIEAGQLEIRRQHVHLASVIADALELIEPLIQQRDQTTEIQELEPLPDVVGDHQRLTQVFVNLLANASKFGRAGGTIRIGGQRNENNTAVVWVDDDGPGPADTDDEILFSQFRRSRGPDPEQSGLGLGLYIVKSIVERHGGRVTLGRTLDATTRATVELPLGGVNEDSAG